MAEIFLFAFEACGRRPNFTSKIRRVRLDGPLAYCPAGRR
ncbi:hypothetical protein BURPS305_3685 [Burkholderia pseudomallei 305]|nr:hypothetical protein BURPS305_3685 [Burkholderia pseudomallei 305]